MQRQTMVVVTYCKAQMAGRVRQLSSRCSEVLEETRGVICRLLATRSKPGGRLLDIGCWDATGTLSYGSAAGIGSDNLYGIDVFDHVLEEAGKKINAYRVDLERESFPFPDNFFDIVVCNQVFEHLKNVYLPMTEICRVLKPGGGGGACLLRTELGQPSQSRFSAFRLRTHFHTHFRPTYQGFHFQGDGVVPDL